MNGKTGMQYKRLHALHFVLLAMRIIPVTYMMSL